MTKEEIEKEWQKELKKLLKEYDNATKNMTEEEEINYIRENRLNEKIEKLKKEFKEKYSKK